MKTLGNLIINGVGSVNGGTFNKVEINGKGTVNSDIECERFNCNGTGTIHGAVKAESLNINGSASISEAVHSQKLEVAGNSSIGGSVKSDEMVVNGKAKIAGDCEAEVFRAEGAFKIDGLLNAEKIDIKLFGESKAKEIGGRKIKVAQHRESLFKLIKSLYPLKLEAELIEGDDIELEGTSALVVRGKNVKIGKNCEIGLVEYSGEYECSPESVVKELRSI
ncbi:polymer-forming cytoskeletal protein [Cytobacillus firmus]|uniref:polymer-forming cytoskeletal protein n=1 Tax=Cytobacillus firmus TaxID=1399 RepID=UPI0018CDAF0C|nr:polymer-forming cytoskeletal protein [Cytobacillus firmus]MBG9447756.1 cytoplasmic protein [Cytobacillus firmus]